MVANVQDVAVIRDVLVPDSVGRVVLEKVSQAIERHQVVRRHYLDVATVHRGLGEQHPDTAETIYAYSYGHLSLHSLACYNPVFCPKIRKTNLPLQGSLPGYLHQSSQPVVGRAPGEVSELGELSERGVGVLKPQLQHLTERGGQMLGVDGCEGSLLAGCGRRRASGVGRVEVGDAVRVGLGLAQNGPCFVLEDRVVEAHLGKDGRYAVGALGVGDPPPAPAHDLQRCAGEVYAPANEISLAMHELQVVASTTARPVHRAGALERAPQVTGPLRRGTSGAGEPQLFLG